MDSSFMSGIGSGSSRSKPYTWDAENRLVEVRTKVGNNLVAKYCYDYLSRRVYKETATTATLFVYDGWNLVAEYDASAINGTTNATINSLTRTYTWGTDLSGGFQGAGGVGGLLAIEEKAGGNAGHYYPFYDGNGNVTELVKDNGSGGTQVVAHYEYDPFGRLTQDDDTDSSGYHAINPFKFSTKYHDAETGFYYYGYRYYDPVTGRWPSRDPIGEKAFFDSYTAGKSDKDKSHLGIESLKGRYGFLENSPTNKIDENGLAMKLSVYLRQMGAILGPVVGGNQYHVFLEYWGQSAGFSPGDGNIFGGKGIVNSPDRWGQPDGPEGEWHKDSSRFAQLWVENCCIDIKKFEENLNDHIKIVKGKKSNELHFWYL